MNLSIDRKALLADLPSLVRIADAKNSIPVLHHVQAAIVDGRLELAATDLDTSLRTTAETLEGPKGDAILLPAKKFLEIVRAMGDGTLAFETDDHHVRISSNGTSFRIATLPASDYPDLPLVEADESLTISGVALKTLISNVSYAITTEDARYYLAGALLHVHDGEAHMVATDGHRLTHAAVACEGDFRALIPRKAIDELGRLAGTEDVVISQGDNFIHFKVGGRTLSSKKIEGSFPAWEKAIQASAPGIKLTLDTETFANVISRVALMASTAPNAAKCVSVGLTPARDLDHLPGRITVTAKSEVGDATETLAVPYDGEPLVIGLNAAYITEPCSRQSGEMTLGIRDSEHGVTLSWPGVECVVMPMRL